MRLLTIPALSLVAALAPLSAHDRISTKVTWDREISPIVQARCVSCHREGGRAPMSLASYELARPWAKAIKEEVLTRRMPKWHVVRGYGDFTNDRSLSPFEVALIASWADGGAPKSLPASPTDRSAAAIVSPATPSTAPRSTRVVTVPCTSRTLPNGTLLGLRPTLAKGATLRLTIKEPNGDESPLVWIKDFDPAFAET